MKPKPQRTARADSGRTGKPPADPALRNTHSQAQAQAQVQAEAAAQAAWMAKEETSLAALFG